jgi:RNA polymerase sigma-70 factor, ECF subfamily
VTIDEQKKIFESWLSLHKGLIFKIIRVYGRTPMDREDLFQEITFQVWRSIPSFRGESAVTTWIYRIALNVSIRWLRKEKKQVQSESLEDIQHIIHEVKDHSDDERLSWLYQEIHKLDEIDRSITLLMLDGLSYKEMSSIIGITETHIGVKINRIKKQLINRSKKSEHYGV